jgi:transcriptional regulator with XRE-family HTH domain
VARRRKPLGRALGWRICQLRQQRAWTPERLAERAGLDRSYIAGIEAGLRNPSLESIWKVAKALDVTLSTLFDGVP